MGHWLRDTSPERVDVDGMLADARFVYDDGSVLLAEDPYRPHTFVWFHRDLREEPEVPGEITVLHRDERLVVVDKPPFLSTIPRGRHVMQSVTVRLRDELGLPELTPLHRLDRVTSGVLLLATERRWRGAYQTLFEHRRVRKTYLALAPRRADLTFPLTVRNHIAKTRGVWQAQVVPGAPVNAITDIEVEAEVGSEAGAGAGPRVGSEGGGLAVYRLTPHTGRTHQLRLHLRGLGIPIVGDPLYPEVLDVSVDDFSNPLQLLASTIELVDPVDGRERRFVSGWTLPIAPPA